MITKAHLPVIERFITKFTAIPDEKWHEGYYTNDTRTACCALGHCETQEEMSDLHFLFMGVMDDMPGKQGHLKDAQGPAVINDGRCSKYQQETPKLRILAALQDLKDRITHEYDRSAERYQSMDLGKTDE